MTTPSGPLIWGQAGIYDAVDDREVITALANHHQGLVKPITLAPGAGLYVDISPGWLGVADCGDSTQAIVGSRQTLSVPVPAGPATGTSTWYLWCDVDPDASTWVISAISTADAVGRSGIQLGTVTAPAGANLASQMSITAMPPTFGEFEGITFNTTQTGGKAYLYALPSGMLFVQSRDPDSAAGGTVMTSLQDSVHRAAGAGMIITPKWTIPVGDITPLTHYEVWACGYGVAPNPANDIWFDLLFQPDVSQYPRVGFTTPYPAGAELNWEARGQITVNDRATAFVASIWAQITPITGNVTGANSPSATRYVSAVNMNPNSPHTIYMRCSLGSSAGAKADAWSATFTRRGGADSTGQITP